MTEKSWQEASVAGLPATRAYPIRFAEAEMMKIMTEGREPVICENALEVWSVAVDRKPEVVINLQSSKQIADMLYSQALKPCQ